MIDLHWWVVVVELLSFNNSPCLLSSSKNSSMHLWSLYDMILRSGPKLCLKRKRYLYLSLILFKTPVANIVFLRFHLMMVQLAYLPMILIMTKPQGGNPMSFPSFCVQGLVLQWAHEMKFSTCLLFTEEDTMNVKKVVEEATGSTSTPSLLHFALTSIWLFA